MLESLDYKLLQQINSLHTDWLDTIMYFISHKFSAIPIYLIILSLFIKYFKKKTFAILFSIAVLITISDQVSVAFKNYVKRYRPTHNEMLKDEIHVVNNYRGGQYGFYSSHASNTMALACFVSFLLPVFSLKLLLACWTFLVGYSRIYLGVHFPIDVMVGWSAGIVIAIAVYQIIAVRIFNLKPSNSNK